MTTTLKNCLMKGGVKGRMFIDLNNEKTPYAILEIRIDENNECMTNIGIAYYGTSGLYVERLADHLNDPVSRRKIK